MDTLSPVIQAHMTEVYLLYGMAFLFLAAAIYLQPKDNSVLPFSTILVWLARFGILHGISELQCAWELIDDYLNEKSSLVGNLLSFASFYALFEFSRRFWLVLTCNSENNLRRLKYIRLLPVVSLLIAHKYLHKPPWYAQRTPHRRQLKEKRVIPSGIGGIQGQGWQAFEAPSSLNANITYTFRTSNFGSA
ncbi:MAG: hypothetical protein IBX56_15195 [Methylomicrobium sp.]|nr:hypothetical protein [Methylomicrobium sp.]